MYRADRMYRLEVICLDRDTGEILWQRTAYEGTVHDQRHRKNTYASGTPATDGRRVIAFFEAEGLYCYDLDGNLLWKSFPGKIAKMGMGPGTSPVLFENFVILLCDQEDGDTFVVRAGPKHEILGTNSLGEPVYASPAISGGMLFIRGERHLHCISAGGSGR